MGIEHQPMPKIQKIIYFILFTLLFAAFIFLGTRNYKPKELSDSQLFNKEYKTVGLDNHFEVLDSEGALTFLENGTGILFLGFPENVWSTPIAEILDEVSKSENFSPIYYFNFLDERNSYHTNYQGILREIDDYLVTDDTGELQLYAPLVVAISHGKVFFYDNDTAFMNYKTNPKSYWTEEKKSEKKEQYKEVLKRIKEGQALGKR